MGTERENESKCVQRIRKGVAFFLNILFVLSFIIFIRVIFICENKTIELVAILATMLTIDSATSNKLLIRLKHIYKNRSLEAAGIFLLLTVFCKQEVVVNWVHSLFKTEPEPNHMLTYCLPVGIAIVFCAVFAYCEQNPLKDTITQKICNISLATKCKNNKPNNKKEIPNEKSDSNIVNININF